MPKSATKKKSAAKSAKKPAAKPKLGLFAEASANTQKLLREGIISPDVKLSEPEVQALDSLSKAEIDAVIATKTKLSKQFFKKQAAHGKYY